MTRNSCSPALITASFLLSLVSIPAWSISNNPDDYDVAKYEHLRNESATRLRQSENTLATLTARVRQLQDQARSTNEQLEQTRREVQQQQNVMNGAEGKINELQARIRNAQQEIAQIQSQLPAIERAAQEEQRRHDVLQGQVGPARQQANQLDSAADSKEKQAAALKHSLDEKAAALTKANQKVTSLTQSLEALESEQKLLTGQVLGLRLALGKKENELKQAKAGTQALNQDVIEKTANYTRLNGIAAQLEKEAAEAAAKHLPNAGLLKRKAIEARGQANAAREEMKQTKQAADAAAEQVARIENELNQLRINLTAAQNKVDALTQRIEDNRKDLAVARDQARAAQQEMAQIQTLYQGAANEARNLRAQATKAQQDADVLQQMLNESNAKLAQLNASENAMRKKLTENQQLIATSNAQLQQQQQLQAKAIEQLRILTVRFQNLQAQSIVVMNQLAEAQRNQDQMAAVVANERQLLARFEARLREVNENLREGMALAGSMGARDGSADGAAEGARQGAMIGSRDGNEIGFREGRDAGTVEAVNRARTRGVSEGQRVGANEGQAKGTADGNQRGREQGLQKGRADGLAAGYEAGRSEGDAVGYQEGTAAGHAMGGFQKGKNDGLASGRERGTREGRAKGVTEGASKADSEFQGASLSEQEIANRSNVFDRPDWGNYNPRPHFPHPALEQTYTRTYRESFMRSAAESYDRVYADSFRSTRQQAYRTAYDQAVQKDFPDHYQVGYQQGYQQTYQSAYNQALKAAYDQNYQPAYQQARDTAYAERKPDGVRDGKKAGFERGKNEAYSGDYQNGVREGDASGYQTAFNPAYDQGFRAGYDEKVTFYSNNAVLDFETAELRDSNDDGVFAPGELFTVSVRIKNFGKVIQKDEVEVRLADGTSGLEMVAPVNTLAKIPGQTDALVTNVCAFRLRENLNLSDRQSVTVVLSQRGKNLGSTTIAIPVSFPYAIPAVKLPKYVAAGEANAVQISIKNVSSRLSGQDVTVRLVSVDGLSEMQQSEMKLGKMNAGEARDAQFQFTFREAFQQLQFEIQVYEGKWLLGRHKFAVDSTRRWAFNPSATGLLVVNDSGSARLAAAAAQLAGLEFDLWDTRIEQALTAETARRYAGRLIVLPRARTLDPATLGAAGAALNDGVTIYLGGSGADSAVSSLGGAAAGLQNGGFGSLAVSQGNFFRPDGSRLVVRSGSDLKAETLAGDIAQSEILAATMRTKVARMITAVGAGDGWKAGVVSSAILRDLVKEMKDDKSVHGSNFKGNVDQLRLTQFVSATLASTGEARRQLLQLTPELEKARKKLGWFLDGRRSAVKKVLKPLLAAYKKEIKR